MHRWGIAALLLATACGSADQVSLGDGGDATTRADTGRTSEDTGGTQAGVDAGSVGFEVGPRPDTGPAGDALPFPDALPRPDTGTPPDIGPIDFDPDCAGCRADGRTCLFSVNCTAGAICNDPSEELYDPSVPRNTCNRVVCADDSQCAGGKVCSLEHLCRAPRCTSDGECMGGQICAAGACTAAPAPATATRCSVLTPPRVVRPGTTIELRALAFGANGAAIPGVRFGWTSDMPSVVRVSGDVATASTAAGRATITAGVTGATTTCSVRITNLAAQATLRVLVTSEEDGAPIAGAQVVSGELSQLTGADGVVSFGVVATPEAVTAIAAGRKTVTVLSPGASDIAIALPRAATAPTGGIRGSVDLSATRNADVRSAVVGVAIPPNPLDARFGALAGDLLDTVFDAPEIGLNGDNVRMPGGFMLALGARELTDDSAMMSGARCGGAMPVAQELGCFAVRARPGTTSAWTIAGQLRLSSVTAIAARLSGLLSMGDVPPDELLVDLSPLLRRMSHGVRVGVDVDGTFQRVPLAADVPLSVLQVVSVPQLPAAPGGGFAARAVLFATAELPGTGLVPLGVTAARDANADGRVDGEQRPFGDQSAPLADGTMALAAAPLHGGLEGSRRVHVAIAMAAGPGAERGARRSVLIAPAADTVAGPFLAFPGGTFNVATRTFTPGAAIAGATELRLEIAGAWIIHAPAGSGPFQLPQVGDPTALVRSESDIALQAAAASVPYSALWAPGAPAAIRATSLTDCRHAANAHCRIQ